jgi:hypothetical protein
MQILRYGHIAAAIREAMPKANMKRPVDLAKALGKPGHGGLVSNWLMAKGAPGDTYRTKVSKLLHIQQKDLRPRKLLDGKSAPAEIEEGEPQSFALVKRGVFGKQVPVLSFQATADGQARIQVDVTMAVDRAMPLFRMLLDAGLVLGASGSASLSGDEE